MAKELLAYHRIRVPTPRYSRGCDDQATKPLKFPLFINRQEEELLRHLLDSFVETTSLRRASSLYSRTNEPSSLSGRVHDGRKFYVASPVTIAFASSLSVKSSSPRSRRPNRGSQHSKPNGRPIPQALGHPNVFASRLPTERINASSKSANPYIAPCGIRGYGRIDLRVTPEGEIVKSGSQTPIQTSTRATIRSKSR